MTRDRLAERYRAYIDCLNRQDWARLGDQFVGPQAEVLDLFGDKAAARALAERLEVPLVAGINRAVSVEEAEAFLEGLGDGAAVMLKALAGGGGRGMRAVEEVAQLADAYRRCRAEAQAAFGRDELYVEQRVARARHIEVQDVRTRASGSFPDSSGHGQQETPRR